MNLVVYSGLSQYPAPDALLFGTQWQLDAGGVITYSFPEYGSLWDDYGAGSEPAQGFAPLSGEIEREAVRDALACWSSVANIRFLEVADDASGSGTLRIGYTTLGMDSQQLGYAYAPNDSLPGGDVWLNAQLRASLYSSFAPGTLSSYIVLHELGHAIGLKHPHSGSPLNTAVLASPDDSLFNTVMSYYAWPGITLTQSNIDRLPSTPMALDIDALQALYGANAAHNGGDDIYIYDGDGKYLETIYDTGGNDTLRVTGHRSAAIDLRGDEWSRLGMPVQIDGSAIQPVDTVRIYRTTLIENAIGGEGDDRLIGNDASNRLDGGKGADTLIGGAGNDFYRVDHGGDSVIEAAGQGIDTVIARIDYTLPDHVENLLLNASVTFRGPRSGFFGGPKNVRIDLGIDGTGNAEDNLIIGNRAANELSGGGGADRLIGGAGNDTLSGGAGADVLSGGAGADVFVFDVFDGSIDRITDFGAGDAIRVVGSGEVSFDAATGELSLDAVQFAVLNAWSGSVAPAWQQVAA